MKAYKSFEELKGQTITSIEHNENEAVFTTSEGKRYQLYHDQDCCESVLIQSVEGDIQSVLNSPIDLAYEKIAHEDENGQHESVTYSDFILETENVRLVLKWVGESNGYYSESVTFIEL